MKLKGLAFGYRLLVLRVPGVQEVFGLSRNECGRVLKFCQPLGHFFRTQDANLSDNLTAIRHIMMFNETKVKNLFFFAKAASWN